METITISSAVVAPSADQPLTPAMVVTIWHIAALMDETRIPATVENAIWVETTTARLRGPGGRDDNVWLRQCLDRLTSIKLAGQHNDEVWGAVLVAEWNILPGGSRVRLLIPPRAVHALRSPTTFAKVEIEAAHRLPAHARRLYTMLADRKRQREPYIKWSLSYLRAALGLSDKRAYDRWSNLRQWVLDPAIREINEFGTVHIKMTPTKDGRSVSGVRFDWRWKSPQEAAQTLVENDRHSLARGRDLGESEARPLTDTAPDAGQTAQIEHADVSDPDLARAEDSTNPTQKLGQLMRVETDITDD